MDHIGIDVHKRESQICILAEGGELIERRIRTEPERFAAVLGGRPRARIVLEASTDSEWVARCLEALGHEVVVADPTFAPMYATRTRKLKTDRRDARALAEACLLGAYRPAHRLSDMQRQVRGRLLVRDALVRTRTRYISLIRALLRQHGYRVSTGSAEAFPTRVRALALPGPLLSLIAPLLAVMRHLNRQLVYSDETIERVAAHDARVQRLRTVPSVGPVTAAAFVATVDDVQRFRHAHHLEAYLGPRAARDQFGRHAAPWPDHQGRLRPHALAAHPSRRLHSPAPAARGRGPPDLGPPHRGPSGQARGRRRARPPPRRHPLCLAPRWHGLHATPHRTVAGPHPAPHAPRSHDHDKVMEPQVSRTFDRWVSATVALAAVPRPLRRWRPHPRIPSCAGDPPGSPLMSANRRMTTRRETQADISANQTMDTTESDGRVPHTRDLTRPAAS